ncbi:MAG: haloalkane dehalogenase [Spirochaetaceae bacterium]|nr:haloalkane dehalogenase [Spirochaetaceae bacterium]
MMDFVRTPEEAFDGLPGYSFSPHYVEVNPGGLRMHYVEEGPENGAVVLLLHGEPSWSYLYRKMIPPMAQAGFRVIAPDLIGFGRSDKPTSQDDYSYQNHVDWLKGLIQSLDLKDINLFCQDWGGLLGLRIAAEMQSRFQRIAAGNTFLPTGDQKPGEAFFQWRDFSQKVKRLPVGRVIGNGCFTKPNPEVIQGYNAPFPDESYKAGARIFPALVPVDPDDPAAPANRRAWEILQKWEKPFLCTFSDSDPITKGADAIFRRKIPGCKGRKHITIENAGHFLQEDQGEVLAKHLIEFFNES